MPNIGTGAAVNWLWLACHTQILAGVTLSENGFVSWNGFIAQKSHRILPKFEKKIYKREKHLLVFLRKFSKIIPVNNDAFSACLLEFQTCSECANHIPN